MTFGKLRNGERFKVTQKFIEENQASGMGKMMFEKISGNSAEIIGGPDIGEMWAFDSRNKIEVCT